MNKENYIRKSHSFTKKALDHLNILSKYMGDVGESAVLRYLIINEIRKVPNPHNYGQVHVEASIEDHRIIAKTEIDHQMELAKRGLPSIFPKGIKEEELAKLRQVMLIKRLIGESFDGHEATEAEIKGLDYDAIGRALWVDEE